MNEIKLTLETPEGSLTRHYKEESLDLVDWQAEVEGMKEVIYSSVTNFL